MTFTSETGIQVSLLCNTPGFSFDVSNHQSISTSFPSNRIPNANAQQKRVAVLGGTGYLGKFVVAELAAEGFNVVVFSRSKVRIERLAFERMKLVTNELNCDAQEENVPSGVEVREVEEDVAGLASKLQGVLHSRVSLILHLISNPTHFLSLDVDAVVSALAFPLGAAAQSTALRAAKQAGSVKRFVLSEFGTDYTDIPSPNPFDAKKAAIKLATELGIEWAGIPTGLIIENFASGRSAVDGIKGTAIVVGTGDEKFGYTSLKDIARAVAGSLKRKEGKGWLPIQGGEITDKEVIALFEKESGELAKREAA